MSGLCTGNQQPWFSVPSQGRYQSCWARSRPVWQSDTPLCAIPADAFIATSVGSTVPVIESIDETFPPACLLQYVCVFSLVLSPYFSKSVPSSPCPKKFTLLFGLQIFPFQSHISPPSLTAASTYWLPKSYHQQKYFIEMLKITALLKLAVPMGRTLSWQSWEWWPRWTELNQPKVFSKSIAAVPFRSWIISIIWGIWTFVSQVK